MSEQQIRNSRHTSVAYHTLLPVGYGECAGLACTTSISVVRTVQMWPGGFKARFHQWSQDEGAQMSIDKTTKLTSTRSEENANLLLQIGWTLLLVVDRREGAYQWLLYQFGWQREGEPPEITFTGVEGGPDPF